MSTTPESADDSTWGAAETTPLLPDLDRPPAAAPAEPTLADRFARFSPASDWFPAVVLLTAVLITVLATAGGLLGQLAATAFGAATWILCVRIHTTPKGRVWVYATEATVIGILLLVS